MRVPQKTAFKQPAWEERVEVCLTENCCYFPQKEAFKKSSYDISGRVSIYCTEDYMHLFRNINITVGTYIYISSEIYIYLPKIVSNIKFPIFLLYRVATFQLPVFIWKLSGNFWETLNRKALISKVLYGNKHGNFLETMNSPRGNEKGQSFHESFPKKRSKTCPARRHPATVRNK